MFTEKFLRDQRASYNQDLQFKLKVGEDGSDLYSPYDVILEGNNKAISQSIFGNGNSFPSTRVSSNFLLNFSLILKNRIGMRVVLTKIGLFSAEMSITPKGR